MINKKKLIKLSLGYVCFLFVLAHCGYGDIELEKKYNQSSNNSSINSDSTDVAVEDIFEEEDLDNSSENDTESSSEDISEGDTDCQNSLLPGLTTGDIQADLFGNSCNAPTYSSKAEGVLILECSVPEAKDSSNKFLVEDYILVKCASDTSVDIKRYYCSDGIVKNFDPDALNYDNYNADNPYVPGETGETIFVTCEIDEDGTATLSEEADE